MAQLPDIDTGTTKTSDVPIWAAIIAVFALFAVTGPIKMLTQRDTPTAGTNPLVTMASRTFAPSLLTVASGTTVVFENNDVVDHTVDSSASGVDSGIIGPGERFTLVLTERLDYLCAIHPSMRATVEIGS